MKYKFRILRYYHDIISEEFVNIGIVVYFSQIHLFSFKYTSKFKRISRMFLDVDIQYLKRLLNNIESKFTRKSVEIKNHHLFNDEIDFLKITNEVFPIEDRSLRFSDQYYGTSDNPGETIKYLFQRYVSKYSDNSEKKSRDDEEVWKVFKVSLDKKDVTKKLTPHKIVTKDYEYEFEHSWKNKIWHLNVPLSFDLVEGKSILDKANTWLGRATSLSERKDFKLFFLMGKPQTVSLKNFFIKAKNILNKMPCNHEFVNEDEAESFAEELSELIKEHN